MTIQYIFGTGFEYGTIVMYNKSGTETPAISGGPHTGDYCVQVNGGGSAGYIDMPTITGSLQGDELYLAFWADPHNNASNDQGCRAYIFLVDGQNVSLHRRSDDRWDAFRAGTLIASGVIDTVDDYHHVQIWVKIDNTVGRFVTKIDGVVDIDFTGDTQPVASNQINGGAVRFQGNISDWRVDDIVYGTGDWMSDIRFDHLRPSADNAVEWEPSTGADNYAMVDEASPSDADYVRASGTAHQDKYDLEAWTSEGKSPVLIGHWTRAKKEIADASQIILQIDDGTEGSSNPMDLATAFAYHTAFFTEPPGGGVWDAATIDSLLMGYEAVIP